MVASMGVEKRKHPRVETVYPIRFNLNPDYHFVFELRKIGVGGTIRNISSAGLMIDSRLDLLDVCQIFSEAMEEDSPFELEVTLTDSRERKVLIRGAVKWYRLSEPDRGIRHFQAGLYLKDDESIDVTKGVVESVTKTPMT
jgi:hypothetical protein